MSSTALKSIAFAAVLGTTPVSAALILTTGAGAPTPPDSSSAATSSDEWTPAAIENLKGLPQSASSAALLTLPADEGPQLFSRGPVIAHTAPTAAKVSGADAGAWRLPARPPVCKYLSKARHMVSTSAACCLSHCLCSGITSNGSYDCSLRDQITPQQSC